MSHVRRLPGKSKPVLAYRKRGLTEAQFEALTERTIFEVGQMEANASEDARLIMAALPDMNKLEDYEGDKNERYAFAFLFMRAMDTFREKSNPFSIIEIIDIVSRDTNSARALLRHAPHRKAREFVHAEWELHRANYDNNKSAFARDYVRRVWNEMKTTVTEKQMREVWLRDTPPTGKPAGLPAAGE